PMLESLPWPAQDRLFSFLRSDKRFYNLVHLSEVAGLLSSSIKHVEVGYIVQKIYHFSCSDLSLCARLLHGSTIEKLVFESPILDDATAPLIFSIISRASNHIYIQTKEIGYHQRPRLSDPEFGTICLLSELCLSLNYKKLQKNQKVSTDFPAVLYQELSKGSFEWVKIGGDCSATKINKAPVNIPNSPITSLEWVRAKKK
ncbi:hypothetical protein PMAYCL1PPCAC_27166, partial [Pristionchus mayeri]